MSFCSKHDFYTTNCNAYQENMSWRFISAWESVKRKKTVCKWKEEPNELWRVYFLLHPGMFVFSGFLGIYVFCMCVCVCFYTPFVSILSWVYPQCVCSLGHGTSACMPSIQLWEGGVVIVGLSIFHVLLACLFPPSNSLWGEKKKGKKKKNTRLMLWFFIVSAAVWSFIYFLFFSSGSVFVLGEAFLLPSRIFRVKGSLCALLLDLSFWKKSALERWNVRWGEGGRGREKERDEGRETERERGVGGGVVWRPGLKRHTRVARNQSLLSVRRAPSLAGQSIFP